MEIDHLGIAVKSLPDALARWAPLTGPPESAPEVVPSQRVRAAFVRVGGTDLEFLEPTDADSSVGKFLAHRGEGFHHIAFRVPSVNAELAALDRRGLRLVDRVARPGARGRRVGFAHPSAFQGVLVEFVEGP